MVSVRPSAVSMYTWSRSGSRVLPIPCSASPGIGFKTLSEAAALRNRAIQHLETAEGIEDRDERREWLTFVFVGGGYAGLEGIAELQDYVADMVERYPRCRLDGTRWMLVEATDRVMQEIPAGLARFATEQLCARGAWPATTWPPRWPAGQRGGSATAPWACSWTWASTRPWPPCSACRCAASPPGSPPAPTTSRPCRASPAACA